MEHTHEQRKAHNNRLMRAITMSKTPALLILCAIGAHAQTGSPTTGMVAGCTVIPNIDFNGHDLGGGKGATSATECAVLCSNTAACTHYTYAVAFNGCYLKDSGEGERAVNPSLNAVSGVCPAATTSPSIAPTAAPTNTPLVTCTELSPAGCCRTADGGLGTYTVVTVTELASCEAACAAKNDCIGIELETTTLACELHSVALSHTATIEACAEERCFSCERAATSSPSSSAPTPSRAPSPPTPVITLSGELRQWHKVTVDVEYGMTVSERSYDNPFLDLRFVAVFTHASTPTQEIRVHGYFAADGNAAETGADSGRVFRAHFVPPLVGSWTVRVEFTSGEGVAVAVNGGDGFPVPRLHGETLTFTVENTDKVAPDFRSKGMLLPVPGERYLVFNGTGERFLKAGADSPENLLAFYEFDNTWDAGNSGPTAYEDGLHHYDAHLSDWREGDPTWHGDKGKRLIGALNYLASEGANAISFLTYNYGGDGSDVWPHRDPTAAPGSMFRMRYVRIAKLPQFFMYYSLDIS